MKYHHYLSMPWSRTFGLNVHIQKGVSQWPIINATAIQIQDRQLVITLNVFSREIQYLVCKSTLNVSLACNKHE